jgi:hypothetical protein
VVSYRFYPHDLLPYFLEFPDFIEFWGLFGGFLGDSWDVKGHLKASKPPGRIRGISAVCVGFSRFFAFILAGFSGASPLLILYII